MLLLLTFSTDGTSDQIVDRLDKKVFRYNFDQLSHYRVRFGVDDFEIINPAGFCINSKDARSVFWWKAFSITEEHVDAFLIAEAKYLFFEIYSWFQEKKTVKGNSIRFHDYLGKIAILRRAQRFFKIPKSVYTVGLLGESDVPPHNRITKSLSSQPTSAGTLLFTTDVSDKDLDPNYPWFLQEKVNAKFDVTCLLVDDQIFSFIRDRKSLKGLDWRPEQSFDPNVEEWTPYSLTEANMNSLKRLIADLNVEWGRFDFMLDESEQLVFLEFNANGQFVFLEHWDKWGLMDAVARYLMK